MQHQQDFWPAEKKAPYEQGQWESLSIEERAERTVLLARLIAKAICPISSWLRVSHRLL